MLEGLARPQKALPSRFFYDARGSALFEQITTLDEYYLTRTEIGLLERHAGDMAALIGARASVIEFGSGSSRKVPILLRALEEPAAWVPIDIDDETLAQSVRDMRARFPDLRLVPIHADFMQPVALPAGRAQREPGRLLSRLDDRQFPAARGARVPAPGGHDARQERGDGHRRRPQEGPLDAAFGL